MDARELRIGNYAQDKMTGELLVCCGLDGGYGKSESRIDFWVHDRSKMPLPDGWQAELIPITEEWLKRLGFEHSPEAMNYNLWVGNGIVGEFIGGLFQIQASGLPQCNQVHQLQNLYFALTGQELEIKEP